MSFKPFHMDSRAVHLEYHKKLNKVIQDMHEKKQDTSTVRALEELAFLLSEADLPEECNVEVSLSTGNCVYIHVFGVESFADVSELQAKLNQETVRYWRDPKGRYDQDEKCKSWNYYLRSDGPFNVIGTVELKAYANPETHICKIVETKVTEQVPASVSERVETTVLCPGDPGYYDH